MLQEQRKLLHERTGQALETVYASALHEHYSDLAHHYRRSPNTEKAITYLQPAGQQAVQHSANHEAISHLTAALDLLLTRPETPERAAQELTLRLAVGSPLMTAQGWSAPAVEQHYTRAWALCGLLGDSRQRVPVLWGLWGFHVARGELRTAQALAEECLRLAEQTQEAGVLLEAHYAAGASFLWRGEFVRARALLEQSDALYQPQHQALAPLYGGVNPMVAHINITIMMLWYLGYPEQALTRSHEALHLAQELGHPFSLVHALTFDACWLHLERGDGQIAQERADAVVALAGEHGFPYHLAVGTIQRGAALITQEQWEEGIVQVRQGLEAVQTMGIELWRSYYLVLLAETYGKVGQPEEGLSVLAEAVAFVDKTGEWLSEAEVYRIKGQLTLQQSKTSLRQVQGESQASQNTSEVPSTQHRTPSTQAEAEGYFQKAIEIAQKQQAKSLELRAGMSLARLWQRQGKKAEAHNLLAEIYGWFTEGFDTKDLQQARALLDELKEN